MRRCPYCTRVKDAFVELGVEARSFELDGFGRCIYLKGTLQHSEPWVRHIEYKLILIWLVYCVLLTVEEREIQDVLYEVL